MINFSQIQSIVCIGEGVASDTLKTKTRKREIAFTRQLIMYFLREHTKETYARIGLHFGLDHATCLYGIKTINNLNDTDRIVHNKIIMYEIKFEEIIEFENNIIVDKIEEIRELLKAQIERGRPISYESVTIYNKLLEKTQNPQTV